MGSNAAEQGCLKLFFILQPQLLNQKAFRPFKKTLASFSGVWILNNSLLKVDPHTRGKFLQSSTASICGMTDSVLDLTLCKHYSQS